MEEKIIQTRHIYKGRVVKLDIHEVLLPDNKHSKRELVNHPGAVAIVALDNDNQVLMVRQYRLGARQTMLEVPAGTLDAGEDPAHCATRELQEETGFKPGKLQSLGGIYTAPGYTTEYIHLFFATDLIPAKLDTDDDEFLEVTRVPFAKVIDMIEKGELEDGKSISALLRVARQLGK
ncbi:MAG: NUDIX hydrolase [Anaerolineaceae bacterium]|nr:NUDIX hydrolase [Anaerolineaceae bacterium]